jgi:hypothetical protein
MPRKAPDVASPGIYAVGPEQAVIRPGPVRLDRLPQQRDQLRADRHPPYRILRAGLRLTRLVNLAVIGPLPLSRGRCS